MPYSLTFSTPRGELPPHRTSNGRTSTLARKHQRKQLCPAQTHHGPLTPRGGVELSRGQTSQPSSSEGILTSRVFHS